MRLGFFHFLVQLNDVVGDFDGFELFDFVLDEVVAEKFVAFAFQVVQPFLHLVDSAHGGSDGYVCSSQLILSLNLFRVVLGYPDEVFDDFSALHGVNIC